MSNTTNENLDLKNRIKPTLQQTIKRNMARTKLRNVIKNTSEDLKKIREAKKIKEEKDGQNIFVIIFNYILNNGWLTGGLLTLLMGLLIYFIYAFDPFKIVKNYQNQVLIGLAIIFTILACFFLFTINYKQYVQKNMDVNFLEGKYVNQALSNYILKLFTSFGILIGILGAIMGIYWIINHVGNIHTIVTYAFIIISIIVVLAIIYLLFENFLDADSLKSKTDMTKENLEKNNKKREERGNQFFNLIKEAIFFIPCLLIDLIEYLEKQIGLTTPPIWILLIAELVIIILYFLIPFIIKNLVLHEGKEILKGPIYTNNLTNLGNYQNLTASSKINYNYNYGLSLWLYINPQPTSTNASYTKFTSLFNYANKPKILYNAKENIIRIICQNKKHDLITIYEMKNVSYQKWMHFVINYSSGIVDIFIDNNLVASVDGIAPFMTLDKITCGANDGINGGIKNIIYFNEIIPKNKLLLLFNSKNN